MYKQKVSLQFINKEIPTRSKITLQAFEKHTNGSLSPPLEVEVLNTVCKYETEENRPCDMRSSNCPQEVVFVPQEFF